MQPYYSQQRWRQPYETPWQAAVSSQQSLFGGSPAPRQFQPFNMGGGMGGAAMNMLLPVMAQGLFGQNNMVMSQFSPTQNYAQQVRQKDFQRQQSLAMVEGARQDSQAIQRLILGGQTMLTGEAPTLAQQLQAKQSASMFQSALPFVAQIMGPSWIDALAGPGGSSTLLGMQMHRGMRSFRDPITGGQGVTGRSAGQISSEVYAQLYGAGTKLGDMRGVTAGESGALFEQLTMRGIINQSGARTKEEQFRQVATMDVNEGTRRRVAASRLRATGNVDPTEVEIEQATQQIYGKLDAKTGTRNAGAGTVLGQIRGAVAGAGTIGTLDTRALEQLGGAGEMLNAGAAQQISSKLKDMSGSVAAMRDIFGDMGKEGTFQEIINGLNALTQGGLSTMSPGQIEHMVRTTKNLAEVSGLGIEGIASLQGQASNLGDRLGVHRTLTAQAVMGAAAFTTAYRQSGSLGGFNSMSLEEVALKEVQLRTRAAASQNAQMLGATMRMRDLGMIDPKSDMGLWAAAIEGKQLSWKDTKDRERSMNQSGANWKAIVAASDGDVDAAMKIYRDTAGSQYYMSRYGTPGLTRRLQPEIDIYPTLDKVITQGITGQMRGRGINKILAAAGKSPEEIKALQIQLGEDIRKDLYTASDEVKRDPTAMQKFAARSVEQQIIAMVVAEGGDEAAVRKALATKHGGAAIGAGVWADIGAEAKSGAFQGYGNARQLFQMQNPDAIGMTGGVMSEAESQARMDAAYATLGRTRPIQRFIGAIQDATPGTTIGDVLLKGLGALSKEDIARLEAGPAGALTAAQEYRDYADRDASGTITKLGAEQQAWAASAIIGLASGGSKATDALDAAARMVLGPKATGKDLSSSFFKARSSSGTPQEQKLNAALQRTVDGLRLAHDGRSAATDLASIGVVSTEEELKRLAAEATKATGKPHTAAGLRAHKGITSYVKRADEIIAAEGDATTGVAQEVGGEVSMDSLGDAGTSGVRSVKLVKSRVTIVNAEVLEIDGMLVEPDLENNAVSDGNSFYSQVANNA